MKNKESLLVALILIIQVLAGVFHLSFAGELRRYVFWIDMSVMHIGLTPSLVIWYLVKKRAAKMLSLTLVMYSLVNVLMEIIAAFGYKELVTTLNSYYLSELILILLAFILCFIGQILTNGISDRFNMQFHNILEILWPNIAKRKKALRYREKIKNHGCRKISCRKHK